MLGAHETLQRVNILLVPVAVSGVFKAISASVAGG